LRRRHRANRSDRGKWKKYPIGTEIMGEPTIEVLCKHCGQTFTAFLKEMADKNARVTCPCCGTNHKNGKDSRPSGAVKN